MAASREVSPWCVGVNDSAHGARFANFNLAIANPGFKARLRMHSRSVQHTAILKRKA